MYIYLYRQPFFKWQFYYIWVSVQLYVALWQCPQNPVAPSIIEFAHSFSIQTSSSFRFLF